MRGYLSMLIKVIDFKEIKPFKSIAAKERVTLENPPEAVWFGAYEGEELVGFNCSVIKNGTARYKSDYVLKAYRGKGIYNDLFAFRLAHSANRGVLKATAFCTPMSIGTFMRYGFVPKSKKIDIIFVVKEF